MPQQTSTFESHFLTHKGVAGAYHKLIACSWVPILQVGGLGNVWVNCFPKAITTWLGWESNPRPPDPESDALTTLPRCPYCGITTIGREKFILNIKKRFSDFWRYDNIALNPRKKCPSEHTNIDTHSKLIIYRSGTPTVSIDRKRQSPLGKVIITLFCYETIIPLENTGINRKIIDSSIRQGKFVHIFKAPWKTFHQWRTSGAGSGSSGTWQRSTRCPIAFSDRSWFTSGPSDGER